MDQKFVEAIPEFWISNFAYNIGKNLKSKIDNDEQNRGEDKCVYLYANLLQKNIFRLFMILKSNHFFKL